jgi:hypothetical protein
MSDDQNEFDAVIDKYSPRIDPSDVSKYDDVINKYAEMDVVTKEKNEYAELIDKYSKIKVTPEASPAKEGEKMKEESDTSIDTNIDDIYATGDQFLNRHSPDKHKSLGKGDAEGDDLMMGLTAEELEKENELLRNLLSSMNEFKPKNNADTNIVDSSVSILTNLSSDEGDKTDGASYRRWCEEGGAKRQAEKSAYEQWKEEQKKEEAKKSVENDNDIDTSTIGTIATNVQAEEKDAKVRQEQKAKSNPTSSSPKKGRAVTAPFRRPKKLTPEEIAEQKRQENLRLKRLVLMNKAENIMNDIEKEERRKRGIKDKPKVRLISDARTLPEVDVIPTERVAKKAITDMRIKLSAGNPEVVAKPYGSTEMKLLESPFATPFVEKLKSKYEKEERERKKAELLKMMRAPLDGNTKRK